MDLTWKLAGACRFADTEMFFPTSDADAGPAKAVCESCQVQGQCLEYALTVREPEGVWGGATFVERRSILRRRRERERARLVSA
ncbi:MAG TPA: WhiB family transcriptional regulator [Acidimicrobiales bacterium]|nr:WhiB family transcriptional regulator [Acidimicrobiales bacterium]